MYLLTYVYNNKEATGFLNDKKNGVIPSEAVLKKLKRLDSDNMINIIELFNDFETNLIADAISSCCSSMIPLQEIKISAPIPYPRRNVICLGKNYLEHIKEVKSLKNVSSSVPDKPIYFSKIAFPATGQKDYIDSHPNVVRELDYEVELAVIIGKKCKNISKESAEDCIFGYTIANDISARDIQTAHVQWYKGKSFDTFCPMGPYIVHKSVIAFPPKLDIKSYVNGELRQNSNTEKLIFDIPTIISDITSGITLYPGDIILTGTPAGVGAGFNPPKFLKNGDKIECVIENLGTLENTVK